MNMKNINLWNTIIKYLNIKEIINLSSTNKKFRSDLNNKLNLIVNNQWREIFDQKFYRISEEKTENEELNNSDEGLKIDFKLLFYKFLSLKNSIEKLTVSEDIFEIFKLHCYLPKIRKINKLIEYSNSSLHQTFFYDIQKNENSLYDYYNNFFKQENKNLLNNEFEYAEFIYDYKQYSNDIIQNEEKITLMKKIINYENLEENCNKNYNNELLNFILWIYQLISLFCIYNRAYIQKYENNSQKFLNEYNERHNSLVQIAMYLNDNYQNINVAFNYIYFYCFGNVEKKFNLYKMIFNIWFQKTFIPLNEKILMSSEEIFKLFLNDSSSLRESMSTNDESIENEISNKEIINEILKDVLDFSIDENNVNYINHLNLPVNDYYKRFENVISNCYINYLQNKIILRSNLNEIIDFLNVYFKENENYFNDEKNIQLINRSKKIILTNIVKSFNYFLQNELLKEFNNFNANNFNNISNNNNNVKIELNFEENVKNAIEKEILNFKNFLYNFAVNNNVNFSSDVINYFIQKSSVINFINKISGFYYEQKNYLEEISKKIENFLLKKNNFDTKIFFNENLNFKKNVNENHQNVNENVQNGIFVNNS